VITSEQINFGLLTTIALVRHNEVWAISTPSLPWQGGARKSC